MPQQSDEYTEQSSEPAVASRAATSSVFRQAKFSLGQVVKHKFFPFRGVIFDVDPEFNNTEEWWQSIPEDVRPKKDQPFYHLFAENEKNTYVAYVSQQNLLADKSGEPVNHPDLTIMFEADADSAKTGHYRLRSGHLN
ncbi:MAG: heat shock protein HspQ [Pseudomonadota bacterium]